MTTKDRQTGKTPPAGVLHGKRVTYEERMDAISAQLRYATKRLREMLAEPRPKTKSRPHLLASLAEAGRSEQMGLVASLARAGRKAAGESVLGSIVRRGAKPARPGIPASARQRPRPRT
jgi:hypothetical protein